MRASSSLPTFWTGSKKTGKVLPDRKFTLGSANVLQKETMSHRLQALAKDLTKDFPRSPHETVGGFVVAARALDKCRSFLAGKLGEYKFDCPLDNQLFDFAGVTAEEFKEVVDSGADDDAVGQWLHEQSGHADNAIKLWNMQMRHKRVADLPVNLQLFLEGYIQEVVPKNRRVYVWFDVYDLEEGRI